MKNQIDLRKSNKYMKDISKPTIGIYSSSSSLSSKFKNRLLNSLSLLNKYTRLNIVCGKLIFENYYNYTTGTALERAKEFNSLLKECSILLPSIGGWNSNSILEALDYELIKQNKTKIVGFSDTTAIILAIYKMTNVNVYYGQALLKDYDENEYVCNINLKSFTDIVIHENNDYIYPEPKYYWDDITDWNQLPIPKDNMKNNKIDYLNHMVHTGRLMGGNLNTLVSLFGTKYMPEIKEGDILFFEESHKSIAEIERNLSNLKNADVFRKIKGLIVGKFEAYDDLGSGISYQTKILEYIEKKIPIIMDFDCGHTLPSQILVIGATYTIDTINKRLTKH